METRLYLTLTQTPCYIDFIKLIEINTLRCLKCFNLLLIPNVISQSELYARKERNKAVPSCAQFLEQLRNGETDGNECLRKSAFDCVIPDTLYERIIQLQRFRKKIEYLRPFLTVFHKCYYACAHWKNANKKALRM